MSEKSAIIIVEVTMKQVSLICLVVFFLAACGTEATPPATRVPQATLPVVVPTVPPTEVPPSATALQTGGRIEGQVYKDPGHKMLADVTVTLGDPEKKEPVAQVKSDASGNYIFEGVKPGKYSFSVMWEFTNKDECPGGNMFGPSVNLFQKEDGTFIAITSTLVEYEMKAGDDAKINLRVLCSS